MAEGSGRSAIDREPGLSLSGDAVALIVGQDKEHIDGSTFKVHGHGYWVVAFSCGGSIVSAPERSICVGVDCTVGTSLVLPGRSCGQKDRSGARLRVAKPIINRPVDNGALDDAEEQ